MENFGKVAAVIVTYNRLDMLKECIDAVRSQTYPYLDIIVVNNDSTDGTKEFLDAQSDLIVIHQDNCGGAGGFYTGMKYMHEHKYEWLWMMDDDGLPKDNQLEHLVSYASFNSIDYANALVLNRKDRQSLAFENLKLSKDYEKKDFVENWVCPFNGTLIKRKVIDEIGFIKKEMFIWGDEREYTARIKASRFTIGTVTSAIHYHPNVKTKYVNVFPFISRYKVSFITGKRAKIYYRNTGYIDKTYNKKVGVKYMIYFLIRLKFNNLIRFCKYYNMGRRNDYSISLL